MPFASLLQSYESAKSAFSDAQNNISDRTGHCVQEKQNKTVSMTLLVQKLCFSSAVCAQQTSTFQVDGKCPSTTHLH